MRLAEAIVLSVLVGMGAGGVAAQTGEPAERTPPGPVDTPGLPPLECVRQVREARITWHAAGAESALAALDRAAGACPGHLEMLLLRLEILVEIGRGEAVAAERERIAARLASDRSDIPLGALEKAVLDPGLGTDELELLRSRLARLATAEDSTPDPRVLRALAATCGRLGDLAAARDALEPLLETGPPADVRWAVAEIDLASGHWDGAIAQLQAVAAEEPELADPARLLLVRAYAAAGRFEDVTRMVAELGRDDGVWSIGSVVVGNVLEAAWTARDSGRHGTAERLFRTVLELDPDNEHAEEALATLYSGVEARRERAARRDLELRQETDGDVLLEEGSRLLATGDAAAAVGPLRRAAELLPEDPVAWSNLGVAAIRLEDWPLAAEALGRAVALEPGEPGSRMNLGTALARLERCPEALQVLDALVADHPEMWRAEYWRWWCLGREGRESEAAEALARYEAGRSR